MARIGGPLELPEPADRLERPGTPLMGWGMVAGLLLPIVGVVIAIVLLARDEIGPGLAVLVTSGLGFVLALALLAA
jgi:hypothetical protein